MNALEIAKGVKKLFQENDSWIQDGFAGHRFKNGEYRSTSPVSSGANCFCLQGAVDHVANSEFFSDDHGDDVEMEQPEAFKLAVTMMAELEDRGEAVDRPGENISDRFAPIALWNDAEERTIHDVREFVDNVIVRLEKEAA